MLVGLPESLRNKTRGFMGTFNGITSDDLIPKGGVKSIPLDSSLEDTCKYVVPYSSAPTALAMWMGVINA
jgi:hypothetical protein